jgi:hypothetical protein
VLFLTFLGFFVIFAFLFWVEWVGLVDAVFLALNLRSALTT